MISARPQGPVPGSLRARLRRLHRVTDLLLAAPLAGGRPPVRRPEPREDLDVGEVAAVITRGTPSLGPLDRVQRAVEDLVTHPYVAPAPALVRELALYFGVLPRYFSDPDYADRTDYVLLTTALRRWGAVGPVMVCRAARGDNELEALLAALEVTQERVWERAA